LRGAELVLRRAGAQYEDDLNTRLLKGATTLDAFASWPLGRRLQLVARAENRGESRRARGEYGEYHECAGDGRDRRRWLYRARDSANFVDRAQTALGKSQGWEIV
jgi:hypothetical protein